MACPDISVIEARACLSGIGQESDPTILLQVIAQSALAWAQANNPGVDYSLEAIESRACASGIGWVQDVVTLERIAAQNLCNIIT